VYFQTKPFVLLIEFAVPIFAT